MWDLYFQLAEQLQVLQKNAARNPAVRRKIRAIIEEMDDIWIEIMQQKAA